jgi:hypothetical protein
MKNVILLLVLLSTSNLLSQVFDTLETRIVGPGMTYYRISSPVPWSIHLFTADASNNYLKLETIKAKGMLVGREKTSLMASRRDTIEHFVVAAINGDFFAGDGTPNNMQIENGEILRRERPDYPAVAFNSDNKTAIGKPYFTGKVISNFSEVNITGVNETRGANSVLLFNQFYGVSTLTNNSGNEILLRPVNNWKFNDTTYCIIDSISLSQGNMSIPKGKGIISLSGANSSFVNMLSKGDTLIVLQAALPGLSGMNEMMGGHPIMVKDGLLNNMDPNDPLVFNRHPRTAVGINSDSSKIYFVVVDGRQAISAGMTLFELADFMMKIGVYQGVNLDGGGSSAMVIRKQVVNSPSDPTGERDVANALLAVSTAPSGPLSFILISPDSQKIFIGDTLKYYVYGYDQYYNPVEINSAQISFSVNPPWLGTISSGGIFIAGNSGGTGVVEAVYGSLSSQAEIIVKGLDRIEISPKTAVTDNTRYINFSALLYDTENMAHSILPQKFSWVSTDTTVGTIDLVGQFRGKNSGSTNVVVSYLNKSDTALVQVQIGTGTVILDSMETLNNWNISGINIDTILTTLTLSNTVQTIGEASLKIDYNFVYQASQFNWVHLNTDLEVFGIPDSIYIDFYSDGAPHRLFFDFFDQNNSLIRIQSHKIANNANIFETLKGRLTTAPFITYPLKLRKIAIALGSDNQPGQTYTGTIYIDNLRVKYPPAAVSVDDDFYNPQEFKLYNNYPNPFNPTTKIRYSIPVSAMNDFSGGAAVIVKIFDILGNEVTTLVNEVQKAGEYEIEWNGTNYASGVYFYTLRSGNFMSTKKLVLMK